MKNLKYAVLLPSLGAPAIGSYLMVSTPGAKSATPKETPIEKPPEELQKPEVPVVDAPAKPKASPEKEPKQVDQPKPAEEPNNSPKLEPEAKVDARSEESESQPEDQDECDPDATCDMFRALGANSVGKRYQKHLIGTKQSAAWAGKVGLWETNSQLKRNNAPFNMRNSNNPEALKNQMAIRCENAYKLNSFRETTVRGKQLEKEKYWWMIWTYCSKPKTAYPEGWGEVN